MADEGSERPPDSDFQQQNLKAWQPLLTPGWVIGTFFVIGAIFIPVGVVILAASESVIVLEQNYNNTGDFQTIPLNLTIKNKMCAPIYFYYKLTNFYQNHRRYVKSRSDAQLRGDAVTPEDLRSKCDPASQASGGAYLFPCGLVAKSWFSDNFSMPELFNAAAGKKYPLKWTDEGISWSSDQKKYQPFDFSNFPNNSYQMLTVSNNISVDHTSENFKVWMRTAAMPTFKKLRYIIKTEDIKAATGDDCIPPGYTFYVNVSNNFDTSAFEGEKFIVLSTVSWLGGKNDFLGYAYLVVGVLCLLTAFLFLIKQCVYPRPLGEMSYFKFRSSAASEMKDRE